MKTGFDANCFKDVIFDLRDDMNSAATDSLKKATSEGWHIILDEANIIRSEWISVCGAEMRETAEIEIADLMANDKIRLYRTSGCSECRSALKALGMAHRDAKILSIVKAAGGNYMITQDIDFFRRRTRAAKKKQEKIF